VEKKTANKKKTTARKREPDAGKKALGI